MIGAAQTTNLGGAGTPSEPSIFISVDTPGGSSAGTNDHDSNTVEIVADEVDPQQLAERLLAQANEHGVELLGPDGVLSQVTKAVLEGALGEELTKHVGYEKHDPAGRGSGNSRNCEYMARRFGWVSRPVRQLAWVP